MFNINFEYLINIYLPIVLRKPKLISWLMLISTHIINIYNLFVVFRSQKLYDINFTGQTMYLEKTLQDTFGIPLLYIADGVAFDYTYIYNNSEGALPVFIYNDSENENPVYISNFSEYSLLSAFIIFIPVADYNLLTADDLSKLDKIVNYYKLYDRTYSIQTF